MGVHLFYLHNTKHLLKNSSITLNRNEVSCSGYGAFHSPSLVGLQALNQKGVLLASSGKYQELKFHLYFQELKSSFLLKRCEML